MEGLLVLGQDATRFRKPRSVTKKYLHNLDFCAFFVERAPFDFASASCVQHRSRLGWSARAAVVDNEQRAQAVKVDG